MPDDTKLGAYAPPPDDYDTFDARGDEPERRGPLLLLVAAAVFVLFAAVVFSAYNQGVRDRDAPPVVAADAEPFRRAPADPGGYETPGQDTEAYELRTGEAETPAEPVSVTPEPEEPIDAPALRVETADADQVETAAPAPELRDDAAPEIEQPAGEIAAREPAPGASAQEQGPDPTPEPVDPTPDPVDPTPRPIDPTPQARQTAPAGVEIAAPEGDWVVQIAAFRANAEAREAWRAFTEAFPELSAGYAPDIFEIDLGARGVYHRLRVAAFETRGAADQFCRRLQQAGQDCLVASR